MWVEHLMMEYNNPSRTDFYLMALRKAVLGNSAELERFQLKFKISRRRRTVRQRRLQRLDHTLILEREQMAAMIGGGVAEKVTISRSEAERINALPTSEAIAERMRIAREQRERRGD